MKLHEKFIDVLELRSNRYTFKEIAEKLSLSVTRINQIYYRGLKEVLYNMKDYINNFDNNKYLLEVSHTTANDNINVYYLLESLDEAKNKAEQLVNTSGIEKGAIYKANKITSFTKTGIKWNNSCDHLYKKINDTELSVRLHNILRRMNITNYSELVNFSELDLLKSKYFGRKTLLELNRHLSKMGLHLK